MRSDEKSLRWLIDKWLAPTPATPVRVTRFGHAQLSRRRYVSVEASPSARPLTIFFFRHDDGSWCVFPPTDRPAMRADRLAA